MTVNEDILTRLNRLLLATPTDALATPPLPRRMVIAAAAEIRTLRARVAELEAIVSQQPHPAARSNHETPTDA